jgi:hypothetical protein
VGWLQNVFGGKSKKKLMEEVKEAHEIIERNNKLMLEMSDVIQGLNAVSPADEDQFESRARRSEEFQERKKRERERAERMISTFLTTYLDRYKIIGNRFSIAHNQKAMGSPEDMMFKISQSLKLGFPRTIYVVVWEGQVIRIEVDSLTGKVRYSLDSGELYDTVTVGVRFLRQYVEYVSQDILNLPSVSTHRIFEVDNKKYAYVLAKSEKECFFIMKDREMATPIREVSSVDPSSFVRSLKSNLIYCPNR